MADPWIKMLAGEVAEGLQIGTDSVDRIRYSDEPPENSRRAEYVYIARAEGTGWTKIGKAGDVAKRLKSLQCGCPFRIQIVGFYSMDGWGGNRFGMAHCLERSIHAALAGFGIPRGAGRDWFHISPQSVCSIVNEFIRAHRAERGMPASFNPEASDA